ncbi:TVP38/TMEM64 family protein [Lachnobacterium bovis]|uniref:TVP38/TMEM64 family protein n=1 Tax=Lachnobacterium bovis TaxID=140626 RepID=UPI0003B6B9AF|nr:VTT domain-containing protein [Lachnobacterium bovis]
MKKLKNTHLSTRKKNVILVIISLLCIVFITLLTWFIIKPMFELASTPTAFRKYIYKQGPIGTILFIIVLILQVIAAIIPGGPFEIAAGYTYGPLKGALICNIGMTIGSIIAFCAVKRFGKKIIHLFFSSEKIDKLNNYMEKHKEQITKIFFTIFLIPGSPKDLLSYCAGSTNITLIKWSVLCFICRTPAILLSTFSGSSLYKKNYEQFILLIIIMALLSIIGSSLFKKITKH